MSVRKIQWKTKRGEREGWLVDYKTQNGARRSKLFKRKKDADDYHAKVKVEVAGRIHVANHDTKTVAEAGAFWLTSGADLEKSTLVQRRQHLNLHILPFLGKMKLNEITVPVVREFLDKLAAGDETLPDKDQRRARRSPAMVKAIRTSLGSLLADATERGLCIRNAVRDMGRAKRSSSKTEARHQELIQVGVDIPTASEVKQIISSASGAAKVFIATAALTGMRASELRGLTWTNVDFSKSEIHIRQRADMENEMGSPKTKAGRRTIPIGPQLVQMLREWKLACPKGKIGLVFPTLEGNVMNHANIIKQWLLPPQLAAGVAVKTGEIDAEGKPALTAKYTGLHAFRHFYASHCINPKPEGLGLPAKTVQHRLGHSSIQMTLDVYGHLFPREDSTDLVIAEATLL